MMQRHLTRVVLTVSTLVAVAGVLTANDKCPCFRRCHGRLEALVAKLGLSDAQKSAVRSIHADFRAKAKPIEEQVRTARREQREAMRQVLTDEQRARLSELKKAERDERWQAFTAKLDLTEEQSQRITQIRTEYRQKRHDLSTSEDENRREQFRGLRHAEIQAVRAELTEEQRARLPDLRRERSRQRHDAVARSAHRKAVGEKLGVSAEQKEQFRRNHADYARKVEPPRAELKQLHREERAAVAKVLTEEQRAKMRDMRKARGETEEHPSAER